MRVADLGRGRGRRVGGCFNCQWPKLISWGRLWIRESLDFFFSFSPGPAASRARRLPRLPMTHHGAAHLPAALTPSWISLSTRRHGVRSTKYGVTYEVGYMVSQPKRETGFNSRHDGL